MIFLSKFFYVFDIISDHHSKNTADTFILISIFDLISPKKKKKRTDGIVVDLDKRQRELRESRAREERNAECSRGEN